MATFEALISGITATILAIIFAIFVVYALAAKGCLAAGYPTAKLDYTFTAYCVKRVDQTDVVIPLENLK